REHLAERERHVPNALVFRFGEAIAFALTGWPAVDALSHAAPCTSRASLPTRDLRVSRAVGRGSSSTSRSGGASRTRTPTACASGPAPRAVASALGRAWR